MSLPADLALNEATPGGQTEATDLATAATCPAHPEVKMELQIRGARDQFFGYEGAFDYHGCPDCGALALFPRPRPSELGRYYGGYYPDELLSRLRVRAEKKGRIGAAGRLRAMGFLRRLRKLGIETPKEAKLLDVGTGLGSFPRSVRDFAGLDVRGIDFSPACAGFAREVQKIEVDVGELRAQKYPDASFDFVTAWHYFEHVYDPKVELAEMIRILKPGGVLMLETPSRGALGLIFQRRWLYLMPPTHLHHYTEKTMALLMEQAGMDVLGLYRPWFPGELTGSLFMTLGLDGFFPKIFGPARSRLLGITFLAQMIYDVPISLALFALKQTGLLRVFARKPR